jgi:DNA-binding NarL/FixJ family response regulator
MRKLRVLVADDHAVVRQGLRAILDADSGLQVVGEAADGQEAIAQAEALRPDLIVLDISMPRMNGADATRLLRERVPTAKIVVLTVHDEAPYVRELLRAGASGYVLKKSVQTELVRAVHTVSDGRLFLDPSLAEGSALPASGDKFDADVELSSRELDVASLAARGHTNAEIAARLSISSKTVESHKARLMAKLGLKTRAQLVRYALYRGWLDRDAS